MIKTSLTYLLIILLTSSMLAQNVEFTSSVSKKNVRVGERFQVSFTLANGKGKEFDPPEFEGFQVLSGPNQSTSMNFINGNFSQSISYNYVLQATKEGELTIGAAFIVAGGNQLRADPITVYVTKSGKANAGQTSQSKQPGDDIEKSIFLKAIISKRNPYQGEQVTITYKLYSKLDIINYNLTKAPSFTGFWSQDIELPGQIQLTQEVLDGEAYRVGTLKKVALFPQRTGELVIDPMETEFAVRIKTKRKRRSVFDDFFNDPFFGFNTQTVNVKVLSNKLKIKSKALPAQNRPSTFDGAVGSFKLETFLDNHETKTNEPVTLTIKLSGSGNIKLLDPLNIEFPPTIEVYDPKINDAVSKKKNIISGRKTFEYLLIPRHEGEHVIRPFTFSYFDPNKRDYISIASPEFIIRAAKGDEIVSSGIISGFRKEEIELIGEDIRFIKTNPVDFVTEFPPLLGSTKFYVLTISPLVLFFLFLFIWNKYEESMSNILLVKSRKANKMAKKRLSIADKYLKEKDKEKFYEEVSKALWGYISDRLVIQAADLSKDVIQTNLGQKNIAEELINKFTSTIDHCELARYSPTGNPVEMENVYKDSIQLITDIEEELKKA